MQVLTARALWRTLLPVSSKRRRHWHTVTLSSVLPAAASAATSLPTRPHWHASLQQWTWNKHQQCRLSSPLPPSHSRTSSLPAKAAGAPMCMAAAAAAGRKGTVCRMARVLTICTWGSAEQYKAHRCWSHNVIGKAAYISTYTRS